MFTKQNKNNGNGNKPSMKVKEILKMADELSPMELGILIGMFKAKEDNARIEEAYQGDAASTTSSNTTKLFSNQSVGKPPRHPHYTKK